MNSRAVLPRLVVEDLKRLQAKRQVIKWKNDERAVKAAVLIQNTYRKWKQRERAKTRQSQQSDKMERRLQDFGEMSKSTAQLFEAQIEQPKNELSSNDTESSELEAPKKTESIQNIQNNDDSLSSMDSLLNQLDDFCKVYEDNPSTKETVIEPTLNTNTKLSVIRTMESMDSTLHELMAMRDALQTAQSVAVPPLVEDVNASKSDASGEPISLENKNRSQDTSEHSLSHLLQVLDDSDEYEEDEKSPTLKVPKTTIKRSSYQSTQSNSTRSIETVSFGKLQRHAAKNQACRQEIERRQHFLTQLRRRVVLVDQLQRNSNDGTPSIPASRAASRMTAETLPGRRLDSAQSIRLQESFVSGKRLDSDATVVIPHSHPDATLLRGGESSMSLLTLAGNHHRLSDAHQSVFQSPMSHATLETRLGGYAYRSQKGQISRCRTFAIPHVRRAYEGHKQGTVWLRYHGEILERQLDVLDHAGALMVTKTLHPNRISHLPLSATGLTKDLTCEVSVDAFEELWMKCQLQTERK